MHSVLETTAFSRRADALLSWDDRAALISLLASDPLAGDVIPETGGVRKLRFAPEGRGKRGAFRVIYYVLNDDVPLVTIILFAKNDQSDLTPEQRKGAKKIVEAMKLEYKKIKDGEKKMNTG